MPEASRFARRVDALVNASPKSQKRIASEMGYRNPNIVSMFKRGTTRVPFDKVPALALSVGADPVELLRLWLEEYQPQMVLIVERHFGAFLSAHEREWIDCLRQCCLGIQHPRRAADNNPGAQT